MRTPIKQILKYLQRDGECFLDGDAEFGAEGPARLAGWSYILVPEQARCLRLRIARTGEHDRRFILLLHIHMTNGDRTGMTSLAKEAGTDAPSSRFFGDTRVVIDLFGPLIDIDKIDVFRGTNARFATEEAIAERLPPRPDGEPCTGAHVLEVVKTRLQDSKVALSLVDGDILKDLCQAATFATVWIVSSVPAQDVFEAAKVVLKKYLASSFENQLIADNHIVHFPRNTSGELAGVERFLVDNLVEDYTIVVDDSPPFHLTDDNDLTRGRHYDMWLHGQVGGERLHRDLATLRDARRRIADARSFVEKHVDQVKLSGYCAIPGFLVYDQHRRADLKKQVESIGALLSQENEGPPICVFLSGPPGSGKSYFVQKCAAALQAPADYPCASLSGVSEGKFDRAVQEHIDQVFDHEASDTAPVAFLDEVDTAPGGNPVAFRLLMNAMTGKRMTELGLSMKGSKSGNVSRLVWFFAGSAGRTREEFESRFADKDLKTHDFFDRMHFNLEMPGVDDVGQAIIQALASVHRYDDLRLDPKKPIKRVSKDVLLLMGSMQWSSVRQLDTICRLGVGRLESIFSLTTSAISTTPLPDFAVIDMLS